MWKDERVIELALLMNRTKKRFIKWGNWLRFHDFIICCGNTPLSRCYVASKEANNFVKYNVVMVWILQDNNVRRFPENQQLIYEIFGWNLMYCLNVYTMSCRSFAKCLYWKCQFNLINLKIKLVLRQANLYCHIALKMNASQPLLSYWRMSFRNHSTLEGNVR